MATNSPTHIRDTHVDDLSGLESLYANAFPDEELFPLVQELLDLKPPALALTAEDNGTPIGHILFTACHLADFNQPLALLGPLCVFPEKQKKGIGSALIHAGFNRLKALDAEYVYVLGDPAYYCRFGFAQEDSVLPPYSLPDIWKGGWQSTFLGADSAPLEGTLIVPEPWCKQSLWMP